ncbi:MAG: flagellar hook-length control protein FliK [Desulfovibrio sp.]|jgi:flagellar hook-length control protein FliK|nr:flagellar hook-length control protein FliK [Desulfovibrio sp.]
MQFFPAALASSFTQDAAASYTQDAAAGLAAVVAPAASALSPDNRYASFESVLHSFIEEGRTDYTGRPAGFSGTDHATGTLGELRGNEIIASLRKRDVDEETLRNLERMTASGAPMTMGRLFALLSGDVRRNPALEEGERDDFAMLLGKLGLDKNETEEMLALCDAGDNAAMWKSLSKKLAGMDGTADITGKEFSALLKGLDVSDETAKLLRKLFGQADERSLDGAGLDALLALARNEQAKREKNTEYTRRRMRDAVDEALKSAKIKERNAPVDDMRGSRHSEQAEAFMRASALRKSGAADITGDAADAREDASGRRSGKALAARNAHEHSERTLRDRAEETAAHTRRDMHDLSGWKAETDPETRRAKSGENAGDAVSRLLHRIDLAGSHHDRTEAGAVQAHNLNSLAGKFRQEIFAQVENGILQNAQDGGRRLTLQLNPGELGELTVLLSVRQGELNATIRTDNLDAASVIREQLAELKASLEAQGLKVKELDVRTSLNDNAFAGQWDGHQEHNRMRDSAERDRLMRLSRIQRDAEGEEGREDALHAREYTIESTGLHIVA